MKRSSKVRQAGISIITLVIVIAALAGVGVLIAQATPTYLEYQAIVKAIERSKDAGSPQEIRTEVLHDLGRSHPGEVYAVNSGNPQFAAPLYLPKQGDGLFYVIFDGQLVDARVSDIQWDGPAFTAKVAGPNGKDIPLTGKLGDGGAIETVLGDRAFNGAVYTPAASSASGR